MDGHYDWLAVMDVRDCSASSATDKAFILGKIADVEAFNLKLQQLVFSAEGAFLAGVRTACVLCLLEQKGNGKYR